MSDLEGAAEEQAGNWKKFESFGWHDQPEDADKWTIFYTSGRDSGLLSQSNEASIRKALEVFGEDVQEERHSHWGCGYVDCFVVRVYNSKGEITPAFKELYEIQCSLESYPVLDDEDYSRREYEATLENIENNAPYAENDLPDGWAGEVFSWLWDNNQRSLENNDDQGGYPSKEEIREAMVTLGYIKEEDNDDL